MPDEMNEVLSTNTPVAEKMYEFYRKIQRDK
ncbi:Uncharacterised protein [Legionella pneumophila]|nr:Uncharacterised protein [Legionella pneumophila]CZI55052.1 Uncharacterised protein [Legionella pneumophila]CZJ01927.1 Uncharacterised protein [Legionella pneumophila]SNV94619.1 Uncharacterised protein [Legionella pneumophila]SQG85236.1 Uncharacterised protein [Legionella pneumophila]